MVYNTEAQIRAACGMGATVPSSAEIAHWQSLADALIEAFKDDPTTGVAAGIELNRVAAIYNQTRKLTGTSEIWKSGSSIVVKPLSEAEMDSLDPTRKKETVWWDI